MLHLPASRGLFDAGGWQSVGAQAVRAEREGLFVQRGEQRVGRVGAFAASPHARRVPAAARVVEAGAVVLLRVPPAPGLSDQVFVAVVYTLLPPVVLEPQQVRVLPVSTRTGSALQRAPARGLRV